jgi:hypothetical protein
MSLLIVPLLYPDLAGLLNFSRPFQHNLRVPDNPGVGPSMTTSAFYKGEGQEKKRLW